jgi:N-acyl-D-aspartate/D-glutamate deacylase
MDWDDEDDNVNDMHVAQTGTFVVRLNSSVTTLNKGDLIQSNGDGTGKVQADDIMRASTVAKVLSTTKIETYSDGSYIVPCSLHC